MTINKLLGFYVTRSKHGKCARVTWTGFDMHEREIHKKWILDNVSNEEYDGITTFENVSSDIVITSDTKTIILKSGQVRTIRYLQQGFRVVASKLKINKSGIVLSESNIWHGYVNGHHIENARLNTDNASEIICIP